MFLKYSIEVSSEMFLNTDSMFKSVFNVISIFKPQTFPSLDSFSVDFMAPCGFWVFGEFSRVSSNSSSSFVNALSRRCTTQLRANQITSIPATSHLALWQISHGWFRRKPHPILTEGEPRKSWRKRDYFPKTRPVNKYLVSLKFNSR